MYESPDLAFLLNNRLAEVQYAIDAKAEAETVARVQQINSLSAGTIITNDQQRDAIKEKAAAEYAQQFVEQVASVATTFKVKLAS